MKALYTIGLLVVANVFMTVARYGHLKFGLLRLQKITPVWRF
jgi:uncharacterized protein (DUF486 family)